MKKVLLYYNYIYIKYSTLCIKAIISYCLYKSNYIGTYTHKVLYKVLILKRYYYTIVS